MLNKILLIEDDQFISKMYLRQLGNDGFQVDYAADGQVGLAKLKSTQYDLILLDLMLPKIDGFDLLARLRKSKYPNQKTTVIVLSNLGQEEDIVKTKMLGANGYIVKADITPAELTTKIKQLV